MPTPSTRRSPLEAPVVSVFEPPFGSAQVVAHDAAVVPTFPAPATSTPPMPVYVLMLYERSEALSCVKVYVMFACALAYLKRKTATHVPAVPDAGPATASRVSVLPTLSAAVMFVQSAADVLTSVNVAITVSLAFTLTGPVVVVGPPAPPVF